MSRWQAISRLLNACILKTFSFIIVRKFKAWMFMIALIPISARKARDPRLKGGSLSQPRGVRPWEVLDPPRFPTGSAFCLCMALFRTDRGPWLDIAILLTHGRGL